MRLVELEMENFKVVKAALIAPKGPICILTGKNGSGKSTALDAIEWAFGGEKHSPEEPIRTGENETKVRVKTADPEITIRRQRKRGKASTLVVETKDGDYKKQPHQFLSQLYSDHTFDPHAFSRMSPKEQAAKLRELVGLDTTALDEERGGVFATRTAVNSEVKSLASQLEGVVIPVRPGEIGEESDLVAISDKRRQADRLASENAGKRKTAAEILEIVEGKQRYILSLEQDLAKERESLKNHVAALLKAEALVKGLIDPDTSTIDAEIKSAREHNVGVRARMQQAALVEAAAKNRDVLKARFDVAIEKADKLTERLADIDAKKAKLLAAAQFPVPGMSIDGDKVLVNGVPFSQASTAEQLRIGLAMGAALNPTLRIVLMRDASLLDDESMALVEDFAEKHDLLVFLERVGQGGVGIEFSEGSIVGQESAAETATV